FPPALQSWIRAPSPCRACAGPQSETDRPPLVRRRTASAPRGPGAIRKEQRGLWRREPCDGGQVSLVLAVGIFERDDEFVQNVSNLGFVATHQDCIFERILSELTNLGQILVQHFNFLCAGNHLSVGLAPDGESGFTAAAF